MSCEKYRCFYSKKEFKLEWMKSYLKWFHVLLSQRNWASIKWLSYHWESFTIAINWRSKDTFDRSHKSICIRFYDLYPMSLKTSPLHPSALSPPLPFLAFFLDRDRQTKELWIFLSDLSFFFRMWVFVSCHCAPQCHDTADNRHVQELAVTLNKNICEFWVNISLSESFVILT